MTIDPVCGMEVDEESTAEKSRFEGHTYFFCSHDCKEEFDASPDEYTGMQQTGT